MPNSHSLTRLIRCAPAATLLVCLGLTGCATTAAPGSRPLAARVIPASAAGVGAPSSGPTGDPRTLALIPVAREGRYTLVELAPEAAQQDLMQQVVQVTMPATLNPTVEDALRYVLLRSGFVLCQSPDINLLDRLPLPAADLQLGPLTLESALRTLVGPGWTLRVNELTRQVCFAPVSLASPAGRRARGSPSGASATGPGAAPGRLHGRGP